MTINSLTATSILNNISCNAEECLCWIIVLLNILTMFYLVFCSFYRITKPVRLAGWLWCAADLTATITILALHTCLFTILSTVFTALVIMAVLAVILPDSLTGKGNETKQISSKGSYVIHRVDENNFCFALYENRANLLARSFFCYTSIEAAKTGIEICRENGDNATAQDLTEEWIRQAEHPKFELYSEKGGFYFRLSVNGEYIILKSSRFEDVRSCMKVLKKTQSMIETDKVFYAKDKMMQYSPVVIDEFVCGKQKTVATACDDNELNEEIAEVRARSVEIAKTLTEIEEEPDGVEVIGVIWPRSAGREDKVYRYDPNGEKLKIGDVILVPSIDTERVVGVARANHHVRPEELKHPLKKIIRVVKRIDE